MTDAQRYAAGDPSLRHKGATIFVNNAPVEKNAQNPSLGSPKDSHRDTDTTIDAPMRPCWGTMFSGMRGIGQRKHARPSFNTHTDADTHANFNSHNCRHRPASRRWQSLNNNTAGRVCFRLHTPVEHQSAGQGAVDQRRWADLERDDQGLSARLGQLGIAIRREF